MGEERVFGVQPPLYGPEGRGAEGGEKRERMR